MKKLLFVFFIFVLCFSVQAQVVIDNFDNSAADSLYEENVENSPSYMEFSDNASDFVEGSGALDINYVIGAFHPWGSFANAIYRVEEGEPLMDFGLSDSLSIWIKVRQAPTHPEYMVFRLHIADRLSEDGDIEEYIYENTTVFNEASDWFELKIPLVERETDGSVVPNNEGFVRFPDTWGGGTYNNRMLDRDKIVGYNLSAVTTGWTDPENIPADSIVVSYDNFTRFGLRKTPFVFFNGKTLSSSLSQFEWGQSSVLVEENAGSQPGTNVIKWIQGDEYGNGWTGFGYDVSPGFNMSAIWETDSIKLKVKANEGTGPIRVQFEDGTGKVGTVFQPTDDGMWHGYALKLSEMVVQDDANGFSPENVTIFGIMAEASGIAGNIVYLDDIWTGNPSIDVAPPAAPEEVNVSPGAYFNLVTWKDVPNEANESYNVYASQNQIIDLESAQVDQVASNIGENEQKAVHNLRSPATDQEASFYYAVEAIDEAGNKSVIVNTGPITNTAKGVVTISLNPPANFAADGNLDEWNAVAPFRMVPSEGAHVVTNQSVDSDADLSVLAYLAVDAEYLYIAFDVTDDITSPEVSTNSWENDAPDMFIGLFDWRGAPHTSLERGEEPDYHFRFNKAQAILDNVGSAVVATSDDENYAWVEKFVNGYTVEARLSWTALAELGQDNVFSPVEGMRIPIDFAINDADDDIREGIMTYSPINEDNSYQSPVYWTHTWLGNLDRPVSVNEIDDTAPNSYVLSQNYPNPFNPTTTIEYSLEKAGLVNISIFNLLGQKVAQLLEENQPAGSYKLQFNAANLPSGLYFYKIQSGNFVESKKMLLMK